MATKSKTEDQKELEAEFRKFAGLDVLAKSDGGKILIETLAKDIVSVVDNLAQNFKTLTMQEFVGAGAELRSKLTFLRVLSQAEKNKNDAEVILKENFKE